MQTTLASLGYEVELIDLAAKEIPIALISLLVVCTYMMLKEKKQMKKYYGDKK